MTSATTHERLGARGAVSALVLFVRSASCARAVSALALLVGSASCTREVTLVTDDGVLRARGERSRFTGREEGAWSYRYPNGELREEGAFESGARIGVWTQFYPSGQLRSRGARAWSTKTQRAEREGAWTFWHENGVVAEQGLYQAGLRVGTWEFTNHDGSLDAARTGEYHANEKLDGSR